MNWVTMNQNECSKCGKHGNSSADLLSAPGVLSAQFLCDECTCSLLTSINLCNPLEEIGDGDIKVDGNVVAIKLDGKTITQEFSGAVVLDIDDETFDELEQWLNSDDGSGGDYC